MEHLNYILKSLPTITPVEVKELTYHFWAKDSLKEAIDFALSTLYLRSGDLLTGFKFYESRFSLVHMTSLKHQYFPRWNGVSSLLGKNVLLRSEQGFGDSIQFSRFAKTLDTLGASVDILCRPQVSRLIKTIPEVNDTCISVIKDYDFEVMMMSVPALSRILEVPTTPYTKVNLEDKKLWLSRMPHTNKLKVGLCWSGDVHSLDDYEIQQTNTRRSIPLKFWSSILDLDCDFGVGEILKLKVPGIPP